MLVLQYRISWSLVLVLVWFGMNVLCQMDMEQQSRQKDDQMLSYLFRPALRDIQMPSPNVENSYKVSRSISVQQQQADKKDGKNGVGSLSVSVSNPTCNASAAAAPAPPVATPSAAPPAAESSSSSSAGGDSQKLHELQKLVQQLYIAQAHVQLEATEIERAQSIASAAQQALEEAANNVRIITAALHAAQEAVASSALRAQTAQLQLAAHDQLLFTARQRVDALSAQMVGLQVEEGIAESKAVVDVPSLLQKLKQPLPENEKPTAAPSIISLPGGGGGGDAGGGTSAADAPIRSIDYNKIMQLLPLLEKGAVQYQSSDPGFVNAFLGHLLEDNPAMKNKAITKRNADKENKEDKESKEAAASDIMSDSEMQELINLVTNGDKKIAQDDKKFSHPCKCNQVKIGNAKYFHDFIKDIQNTANAENGNIEKRTETKNPTKQTREIRMKKKKKKDVSLEIEPIEEDFAKNYPTDDVRHDISWEKEFSKSLPSESELYLDRDVNELDLNMYN